MAVKKIQTLSVCWSHEYPCLGPVCIVVDPVGDGGVNLGVHGGGVEAVEEDADDGGAAVLLQHQRRAVVGDPGELGVVVVSVKLLTAQVLAPANVITNE